MTRHQRQANRDLTIGRAGQNFFEHRESLGEQIPILGAEPVGQSICMSCIFLRLVPEELHDSADGPFWSVMRCPEGCWGTGSELRFFAKRGSIDQPVRP